MSGGNSHREQTSSRVQCTLLHPCQIHACHICTGTWALPTPWLRRANGAVVIVQCPTSHVTKLLIDHCYGKDVRGLTRPALPGCDRHRAPRAGMFGDRPSAPIDLSA